MKLDRAIRPVELVKCGSVNKLINRKGADRVYGIALSLSKKITLERRERSRSSL